MSCGCESKNPVDYKKVVPFVRIVATKKSILTDFLNSHAPGEWEYTDYKFGDSPRRSIPMDPMYGTKGYRLSLGVAIHSPKLALMIRTMLPDDPQFGVDEVGFHSYCLVNLDFETRRAIYYHRRRQIWKRMGYSRNEQNRFDDRCYGDVPASTFTDAHGNSTTFPAQKKFTEDELQNLLPFPWEMKAVAQIEAA